MNWAGRELFSAVAESLGMNWPCFLGDAWRSV